MHAGQYLILIAILTTCFPLHRGFADVKRTRQQPIEELQIVPTRPCAAPPVGTRRTYFYSEMYCADIESNCSFLLGGDEFQIPPECSDLRNYCLCSYSDEYIVPVKEKDIKIFEPPAPQ